jgi:hypothetical protein
MRETKKPEPRQHYRQPRFEDDERRRQNPQRARAAPAITSAVWLSYQRGSIVSLQIPTGTSASLG